MALAMAASGCAVRQFRESSVFRRGDVEMRGLARRGVSGVGFADRSHESFYASRVRCGKKQKSLALKVAKVQELIKVHRDLVLSSQQIARGAPESSIQRGVSDRMQRDLVLSSQQSDRVAPESSDQMGVSDPGLDRIVKNLQDLQMELESINVKAKKKKGSASSSSSSSSSSSESSDSDTGKADTKSVTGKKEKNGSPSSSLSFSSSTSESDMGNATDTQAFREENIGNQIETSVALSTTADKPVSIIPRAPVETSLNAKGPGDVMSSTFSVIASLLVAATFVSAWFPVSGTAIRDHLRSVVGLCGALDPRGNYGDNSAVTHCITNGAMLPAVVPTEFPGVQPIKKVWQHPRWNVYNSRSRLP